MSWQNDCCPRRRWGKTELSIPVIPFGTQGFGDKFGPVSDDEAKRLIRRAVDIGVNHFDCARCYGNSLRKFGLAIKDGVVGRGGGERGAAEDRCGVCRRVGGGRC